MGNTTTTTAFVNGMGEAKARDQVKIRQEIMRMIGINNRISWSHYLHGKMEITPATRLAIETVFEKFGVSADKVWGNGKGDTN